MKTILSYLIEEKTNLIILFFVVILTTSCDESVEPVELSRSFHP
jgi:hypothetical protein